MLEYAIAKNVYEEMKARASEIVKKGGSDRLYTMFLKNAVSYANARMEWSFMTLAIRAENDQRRSITHDSFMSMLDAVCRKFEIENIDTLMPDRKTKGDFACYIALFLALEQR